MSEEKKETELLEDSDPILPRVSLGDTLVSTGDRPPTKPESSACIIGRAVRARMWKIAVDQLKEEGLIPKDLPWL